MHLRNSIIAYSQFGSFFDKPLFYSLVFSSLYTAYLCINVDDDMTANNIHIRDNMKYKVDQACLKEWSLRRIDHIR